MATQAKEANPYNANKDWHNQEDKPFVSADGAFFKEPQPKVEAQEQEEPSKLRRKLKINLIANLITKKDMMI